MTVKLERTTSERRVRTRLPAPPAVATTRADPCTDGERLEFGRMDVCEG